MNTKATQTGVEEIIKKYKIPTYYFDESLTENQKIEKDWEIINKEIEGIISNNT